MPKLVAGPWPTRVEDADVSKVGASKSHEQIPDLSVMRSRHTVDRLAALAMLGLSAVLVSTSIRYGLFEAGRPGPGLFPGIVSAGLLMVSVAWLLSGAGRDQSPSVPVDVDAPDDHGVRGSAPSLEDTLFEEEPIDSAGLRRIGLVVLWSTLPVFLLDRLGYVPTMILYVGGLLVFLARIRPWIALPGTILGVVLTAYGASYLGIVLPDPLGVLDLLGA